MPVELIRCQPFDDFPCSGCRGQIELPKCKGQQNYFMSFAVLYLIIHGGIQMKEIYRGDIFYANLNPVVGSEQGGFRPVLIVQNDLGNKHSHTVVVAAITSKTGKTKLPTHYSVPSQDGLEKDSIVLLEHVRTIDKQRLSGYICSLDNKTMKGIDDALLISLGIENVDTK